MEQFSPGSSDIFAAASFVNIYSSKPFLVGRLGIGAVILLLLLLFMQNHHLFYFVLTISLVFLLFEIYFRGKIQHENPSLLHQNLTGNLASSFSLKAARFSLSNFSASLKEFAERIIKDREVQMTFYRLGINNQEFASAFSGSEAMQKIDWSAFSKTAAWWAVKEGRQDIDLLALLLSLISINKQLQKILYEADLKESDLLNIMFWSRSVFEAPNIPLWQKTPEMLGPGIADFWTGGWTLETEKYAVDITKLLVKNKLTNILVGRQKEIEQVEEILSRSEKRNVILVGSPGIGKTTIAYGLAQKSISGLLPPILKYKRFLEIDVTSLLAGAGPGELEERLKNLLTETSHAGNIVLFIPEIENLAGGNGTRTNITGHLLTTLNSGRIQVVATTTHEGLHQYIENQNAFSSLFETIDLEEPGRDDTLKILEEAAPEIERKNKVVITYKALLSCVNLSQKYMVDRVLPGKAIDLLDESAAAVSLKNGLVLGEGDIEDQITTKTKIPVKMATGQEAEKLLQLESVLHKKIVGQNEAIISISNALRRARTIERDTRKPIGSFLFLGPTGVGKTETAKALSQVYFGSQDAVIRFDMSEFQSVDSINRLIGAPPGPGQTQGGGEMSEKVRENPYSLILLDEMEKAHEKVQEAFLPVFDEGIMEDSTGRKIVFTNTIIIATSNAGAEYIREQVAQNKDMENLKRGLLDKLQRDGVFKPEFLNRFDGIVVYKPLVLDEIIKVVHLIVEDLANRLSRQQVNISLDQNTLLWLARGGFDPTYGARPLRRFVADNLEEKIAEKILSGEIKKGSTVWVSLNNNQLVINQPTPQNS